MKSATKSVVSQQSDFGELSRAAVGSRKKLGPCLEKVNERFFCPRCDELVQIGNLHGKQVIDPATHRTQRQYRLLCNCCNGAFRILCGYDSEGKLYEIGTPVEITDKVERGSLISWVNETRMDIAVAGRSCGSTELAEVRLSTADSGISADGDGHFDRTGHEQEAFGMQP